MSRPKSLWLNQQSVFRQYDVFCLPQAIMLLRKSSMLGFSFCSKRVQAKLYSNFLGPSSTEDTKQTPYSSSNFIASTSPVLKYGFRLAFDFNTLIGLGFSFSNCIANLSRHFCLCFNAFSSISSQSSFAPFLMNSFAFSFISSGKCPIFHKE